MQTAGVLALDHMLVQMEDGNDRLVNKESVELCSLMELEVHSFKIKN